MWTKVKEQLIGWTIILTFLAIVGGCGYYESHYTRKDCVVVEVQQRLITVEDQGGHQWCYYMDSEDYAEVPSVGTLVDLHMYTAHTDWYIEDDEVERVSTH